MSEAPEMSDAQLAELWLKRRVEALSELTVMWSRTAYTARRTVHTAFANGAVKVEGVEPIRNGFGADPLELAEATLAAIRNYRADIDGPAGLVWRTEPQVRRENGAVQVYTRLCFEPETVSVEQAA